MKREDNISGSLDWPTIGLYLALVMLGWINIYAVVYDESVHQPIFSLTLNSGRQLMFIIASLVIIMGIVILDMRFYETFAYLLYGIIIFLLLLVPIIGKEVGGNKAWLGIGSFGVQPSEFAKFATVLVVARFIGSIGFRMDNLRNQAILFALIGAPMLLILLQKDYGTAMVFLVFLIVFYREGMSPFLILIGLGAAAIFILTLLIENTWILYIGIGVIWGLAILMNRRKKLKIMIMITAGAVALV